MNKLERCESGENSGQFQHTHSCDEAGIREPNKEASNNNRTPTPADIRQELKSESITKRLLTGSFWVIIGSTAVQGLGILSSVIIARTIGKEAFGQYGIVLSSVAMFGVFAGMGMGVTVTKHLSQYRKSDPARAGRIIGISMLIGLSSSMVCMITLIALSRFISHQVFSSPEMAWVLLLGAPQLVLNQLASIQLATLAGLEAFRTQTGVQLITSIARAVFLIPGACLGGLAGTLIALNVASIVQNIALEIAIMRHTRQLGIKIRFNGISSERSTLIGFTLPAFLASVSIGPPRWLCEVLLARQPDGLGQMAILNAGNQWRNAVAFLPQQLLSVTLPVLSSLYCRGALKQYYKTFGICALAILLTSTLVVAGIAFFGHEILSVYGEDFSDGYVPLILLCGAGALHMIGRLLVQILHSRSKAHIDLITSLLRGGAQITIWLMLIEYGVSGLSASIFLSYLLVNLALSVYVLTLTIADLSPGKRNVN